MCSSCGRQNAILDKYIASSHVVNGSTASVIHTAVPDRGKLVRLIADKRRCLLFMGDGRRSVYDKNAESYADDNRTIFNCTHW